MGDLNAAYRLTTFFSCPFNAENAAGTYTITRDDFQTSVGDLEFEVVAGPGDNQITLINPFDHVNPVTGEQDYDVIVTVDPATAAATVTQQAAWHCNNFGCGFGVGSVDGTVFVFSCSGTITLNLRHTVAAGSFGINRFIAQKN